MIQNYAIIENGVVVNIVVADEEWASQQDSLCVPYDETNIAYIGGPYIDGFFYSPKPYNSWFAQEGAWVAPIAMPTESSESHAWVWNEIDQSWISIEVPGQPLINDSFSN